MRKFNSAAFEAFLIRLDQLGFFRYVAGEISAKIKAAALQDRNIYIFDTRRLYFADAEDLAEGGVRKFIEDIQPFLVEQGVRIAIVEEDNSDKGYWVTVNDVIYEMYSEEELGTTDIWVLTTVRAFILINQLLAKAGSREQVYMLYGGNDCIALFLTPEMYQLIKDSPFFPAREKPLSSEDLVQELLP